ncbi:MAG: protein phosphatase 2C domain-containing protein [Desulfosalsimonadaceae bacterium]
MTQLACGAGTDVGVKRSHNEDSFRSEPSMGLWVVADGMGGHQGGEVASRIAVDLIADQVRSGDTLTKPIEAAHHAILHAVAQGDGPAGMGTTVVALKTADHRYEVAWVGDCRAYLWNGKSLRQLTKDHSYVQYLVDQGVILAKDADFHTHQNFIMQALGASETPDVSVDTVCDAFYRGEQILLCSDGLNKELTDGDIAAILAQGRAEQETVDILIQTAVQRGGRDNITVALVSAGKDAPSRNTIGYFLHVVSSRIREWAAAVFSHKGLGIY